MDSRQEEQVAFSEIAQEALELGNKDLALLFFVFAGRKALEGAGATDWWEDEV